MVTNDTLASLLIAFKCGFIRPTILVDKEDTHRCIYHTQFSRVSTVTIMVWVFHLWPFTLHCAWYRAVHVKIGRVGQLVVVALAGLAQKPGPGVPKKKAIATSNKD